ncbi:MAG: endonuclease/exonuclease/phosphatase family protein [Candidatus Liptonbacteria bacterium]|nr:endonuclease/exonuclease/phosphatase family protein [Candidatus Liptonbacteria bacterium]
MKLICLNIWGGKVYEPFMKFVREQSESTDIFCFQEVFRSPRKDIETSNWDRIHILNELAEALPEFNYVFHPVISGVDNKGPVNFDLEMGQAEFVRKNIPIASSGEIQIFSPENGSSAGKGAFLPRNFGYFRISLGNKILTVINIHGFTFRNDKKLDRPERLEQSRLIKEFALKENNPVIICGDFNILPHTESVKAFEGPFIDLIKKYGISTTRSKISPWYGTSGELKFSDYAFVSPEINVSNFQVPDVGISDHLPLIVEFN